MNTIKKEIEAKSRQLQGQWKVVYETLQPQYSKDLEDELLKTFQEEIDWEVMMDTLKQVGYKHITMPWPVRMDEARAHEIRSWCRTNLAEHFLGRGPDWLFVSEQDAIMFLLKWS
jgi:hypothetical protein